jgi:hypothetical protein
MIHASKEFLGTFVYEREKVVNDDRTLNLRYFVIVRENFPTNLQLAIGVEESYLINH